MPLRVLLACFVAQGAWWFLTGIIVAAALISVIDEASTETRSIVDVLVNRSVDVGGVPGTLVQYVLVVAVIGGLVGLGGVFVVPMLLRIFVRIICGGARVAYGWALVANLASWILLVAVLGLLWLIPGAQPIALFLTWIGSSVVSALVLYPNVRFVRTADVELVVTDVSEPSDTERKAT
jgi:hypothetical protein